MTRLNDRIARLERAGTGPTGIEKVEVCFVEPSPSGPIYTGEVCTMRAGESEPVWSMRDDLAGQLAK